MVTNDATLVRIKHDVLYEVAKGAWEGDLEKRKEEIPYTLIPGPQAQFRCCIYKEREIIRQRVKLAVGQCPTGKDSYNVVQVINAACEECPIASYIVTDNCRKCMGKACQNSCRFGAISMGQHRAHIDPNKCKECGICANACRYNAIAHLERPCRKAGPVPSGFTYSGRRHGWDYRGYWQREKHTGSADTAALRRNRGHCPGRRAGCPGV